MEIEQIKQELEKIKDRNEKVEADKAWETSNFRKLVIFVITYIIATIWLFLIKNNKPFLNALVPALGWYLSTLTLPIVKKWWIKKNTKIKL